MKLSGPIQQAVNQLPEWVGGRAKEELQLLTKLLARAGMAERVQLDFSIISNQNYYNGIVFRGYVQGIPEGILSGGQYDRLMEKMSKNAKGVGFAVYLDQLELLDSRAKAYDIDTVLLYDDSESLIDVSHAAAQMAEVGVLVLKQLPECLHYRRLLQMKDGRLEELENNG